MSTEILTIGSQCDELIAELRQRGLSPSRILVDLARKYRKLVLANHHWLTDQQSKISHRRCQSIKGLMETMLKVAQIEVAPPDFSALTDEEMMEMSRQLEAQYGPPQCVEPGNAGPGPGVAQHLPAIIDANARPVGVPPK